jgi:hypothetical protein
METEKTLNERILAITMEVREKYPELSEFLGEMPVTIPKEDKPGINITILKDYYRSLEVLMKTYSTKHPVK